ncbi:MAG: prepilin-type N-terminal cleavage/methylation domain-containing protein [Planctomycetota bacterium]|nr:prepilin-type N-terminal cleavage/methylation domain-containing protein [Planctomycetota bacterium]
MLLTRKGFTLIELLMVLGIVAAITSIAVPAYSAHRDRSRIQDAQVLVTALAGAIAGDGRTVFICTDGPMRRAWDLDEDEIIDGDPAHSSASAALKARAPQGYAGLVNDLDLNLRAQQVDAGRRPVDPWGRPLHIRWQRNAFGGGDVGVFSLGPDGKSIDAPTAVDDITSWEIKP